MAFQRGFQQTFVLIKKKIHANTVTAVKESKGWTHIEGKVLEKLFAFTKR